MAIGWQKVSKRHKTGRPFLVWDDYYFMRVARWECRVVGEALGRPPLDGEDGQWVTYNPYGDEPGRGEPARRVDPRLAMPLPPEPVTRLLAA